MIPFEGASCRQVEELLDAYVDGELMAETNLSILRHLDSCGHCSAAVEIRIRFRSALRGAVLSEPVAESLAESIREAFSPPSEISSSRHVVAAAVVLVITLGAGAWLWQKQTASLQPAGTTGVFDMVADVHRYCPAQPGQDALGNDYSGLVQLVMDEMPADYGVAAAHRCFLNGRLFAHVVLEGSDARVSFVVTDKHQEDLSSESAAATNAAGVPVHSKAFNGYEIAGFETRSHLAFVVSDLPHDVNLGLATSIAILYAPYVRSTLKEAASGY